MIIPLAKRVEAASVLGVELDSLTPDTLKKAYREKAKTCHPDHHGDSKIAEWSRISWANECLKEHLKTAPPVEPEHTGPRGNCRACSGTGRVAVPRAAGFGRPMTMMCVMCRGMGELTPEEKLGD